MNTIVRPITADGFVGFDEFGQLCLSEVQGKYTTLTFISDVRQKVCAICNHGWYPSAKSMKDQYHWRLLDETKAGGETYGFVHLSCYVRHLALNDRTDVHRAIVGARIAFRGLVPMPNRYWPKGDIWGELRPWYHADVIPPGIGPSAPTTCELIIGRRKRVWSIEMHPNKGEEFAWCEKAESAFKKEDVTKEFSPKGILLHAWTEEKMREYLTTLNAVGDLRRGAPHP